MDDDDQCYEREGWPEPLREAHRAFRAAQRAWDAEKPLDESGEGWRMFGGPWLPHRLIVHGNRLPQTCATRAVSAGVPVEMLREFAAVMAEWHSARERTDAAVVEACNRIDDWRLDIEGARIREAAEAVLARGRTTEASCKRD